MLGKPPYTIEVTFPVGRDIYDPQIHPHFLDLLESHRHNGRVTAPVIVLLSLMKGYFSDPREWNLPLTQVETSIPGYTETEE